MNDQLLKFDTLLDSVLIEQFHQTLPSTIRLVDEVKPPPGTNSGSSSGSLKEPDKKKQKKLEDAKEQNVDNKIILDTRFFRWIKQCKELRARERESARERSTPKI